jgi:hypothetical protein
MNAANSGDFTLAFIARNVSVAVLPRCAVQITVVPGCFKHNANATHPTKYVLPT